MVGRTRAATIAGGSAVALLSIALGGSSAMAQGSDGQRDGSAGMSMAAESYQESHGVSDAVAEDAIADQESAAQLLHDNGATLGVDADMWVEHEAGNQTLHVRTADSSLTTELKNSLALTETELIIHEEAVGTAPKTMADEDLNEEVKEITPGLQGMYSRASDGVLVVETLDELTDDELSEIGEILGYDDVELNTVHEPSSDQLTVRGGAAMTSCTTGFAGTYAGEIGVISARHCGESEQSVYDAPVDTSGDSAPTDHTMSTYKRRADIGFFAVPSGSTLSSTFYGDDPSPIDLGSGPIEVGEGFTVCHQGKTTGWACGDVTSIAYQPTYDDACLDDVCEATFVRVGAVNQNPGDSGGPWITGENSAIGIHKGGWGQLRDLLQAHLRCG